MGTKDIIINLLLASIAIAVGISLIIGAFEWTPHFSFFGKTVTFLVGVIITGGSLQGLVVLLKNLSALIKKKKPKNEKEKTREIT